MIQYELEMKVRDYECDTQGIVNNSVYQNYLEHTRHEFLIENGNSFTTLMEKGVMAVVARIEIAYKKSLRPGDVFMSRLYVRKEGVKYVFHQSIYRKSDETLIIKAKVDTVLVVNGKLTASHPELDAVVSKFDE